MTVVRDLSEFSWIDPESVHLVGKGANGVPLPLLAKMASEVDATGAAVVKEFVDGLCGTERCAVCKERLEQLSDQQVGKATMDAKDRHSLGSKTFAFPKQRKEPLNDETHVRNAISRFDQVEGVDDKDRRRAARRILGRAKRFGITVSDDSSVARAAKQTAPDTTSAAARAAAEARSSETTGQGDTASDKTLPLEEAEGQTKDDVKGVEKATVDMTGTAPPDSDAATADAKREAEGQTKDDVKGVEKATVDMTGTAPPDSDAATADAKREAEGQTKELHSAEKDADTPGSAAWEHKDVALGEKAEQLVSQLAEVVHTFTEREKAEGGASKSARNLLTAVKHLSKTTNINLLKEMADMPTDELVKALDELGKARRKKAKAAKAAKAAKREKKAAKAAQKAAKAAGETAADERLGHAIKAANEAKELAEKVAAEDGRRIAVNEAGVVAILRDPEKRGGVFKAFDDAVAEAEARLEKAVAGAPRGDDGTPATTAATQRASAELRLARQRRDTAKMVAQENARAGDPATIQRRLDGRGVALFKNRHELPDDADLRYV